MSFPNHPIFDIWSYYSKQGSKCDQAIPENPDSCAESVSVAKEFAIDQETSNQSTIPVPASSISEIQQQTISATQQSSPASTRKVNITIDQLGTKMKNLESEYNTFIPKTSYILVRCDGRSFSNLTRCLRKPKSVADTKQTGKSKGISEQLSTQGDSPDADNSTVNPFDSSFLRAMHATTVDMMKEYNVLFAHCHSDEITLLIDRCDPTKTGATHPFSGSVSVKFYHHLNRFVRENASNYSDTCLARIASPTYAFDARVLVPPTRTEAVEHMLWRRKDCFRNCVEAYARSSFSQKQLHGLNCKSMIELMNKSKGNKLPVDRSCPPLSHSNYDSCWHGETLGPEDLHLNKEKGFNFHEIVPGHLKYGIIVKKEQYQVNMINPHDDKSVACLRTRTKSGHIDSFRDLACIEELVFEKYYSGTVPMRDLCI